MAATPQPKTGGPTQRRPGKDERIFVRVSADVKRTLERAAEVSGRSLSDFVVSSAFSAARETIEGVERMVLTEEDRIVFLEALSNPPPPNDALKEAAAWYKKLSG